MCAASSASGLVQTGAAGSTVPRGGWSATFYTAAATRTSGTTAKVITRPALNAWKMDAGRSWLGQTHPQTRMLSHTLSRAKPKDETTSSSEAGRQQWPFHYKFSTAIIFMRFFWLSIFNRRVHLSCAVSKANYGFSVSGLSSHPKRKVVASDFPCIAIIANELSRPISTQKKIQRKMNKRIKVDAFERHRADESGQRENETMKLMVGHVTSICANVNETTAYWHFLFGRNVVRVGGAKADRWEGSLVRCPLGTAQSPTDVPPPPSRS